MDNLRHENPVTELVETCRPSWQSNHPNGEGTVGSRGGVKEMREIEQIKNLLLKNIHVFPEPRGEDASTKGKDEGCCRALKCRIGREKGGSPSRGAKIDFPQKKS